MHNYHFFSLYVTVTGEAVLRAKSLEQSAQSLGIRNDGEMEFWIDGKLEYWKSGIVFFNKFFLGFSMKIKFMIPVLFVGLILILSCSDSTDVEPLFEYNQTTNGSLQVDANINTITLDNSIGYIFLNGSSDSLNASYVLNKTVKTKESSLAQNEFDKILFNSNVNLDTVNCSINSPSVTFDNYKCSLNINLPAGKDIYVKKNNFGVQTYQLENNLHIETAKGECIVEGHGGSVEAKTQSGTINVMVLIPDSGYCNCYSTDGNITVQVPIGSSGNIILKSTNGTVSFSNLSIHNLKISLNNLSGTIGTGSGTIYLESVNGNVLLKGF